MTRFVTTMVGAFVLILGCSGAKQETRPTDEGDVQARLLRVDPVDPSETGTTGNFVVRVENGTVKPVTVKKIMLEVNFADDLNVSDEPAPSEGEEPAKGDTEPSEGSGGDGEDVEVSVFEGSASPGEVVASGNYLDVPVSVHLSYPDSGRSYIAFCRLGIARLDVEGSVETDHGSLPLKSQGEIPAPSLPEPKAVDVQVASSNEGQSGDMSLSLRVFNPNSFSFKIKDWRYKLYIHDKLMREATVGVGERIQGNTAIEYDILIPLTEKTWGADVKKLLNSGTIPYRVEGELRFMDIVLPTAISDEVRFTR
ncbi:MAG: LEA type 2 family protein [Pseudomonadota bacterium]